ncbi:MAG: glycosyltransferase [Chitinophagales bacterium]|nr:glycosyltransferase [Chitinophagales bacterium]MDW8394110.1 glycosyltransferase [Chitinophagales bacterium]
MKAAGNLIVLTQSFPYDSGEEHFEEELPYLCAHFERVTVIARGKVSERTRTLPDNCTTLALPYRCQWSIWFSLLHPRNLRLLLTEWKRILLSRRFILSRMRIAAGSLVRALELKRRLNARFVSPDSKPPVVIYSYWFDLSALTLALMRSSGLPCPTVARAHAHDIYVERNAFSYLPFQPFKFATLDAVFFISDFGKRYAIKTYALRDDFRFAVCRLGCRAIAGAAATPLTSRPLRLISIGKNAQIKRNVLALQALERVQGSALEYWVLGDVPEADTDLKEAAERLRQKRPHINLRFLGWLSRTEYIRLLEREPFDLMLHLSATEGLPVSMMEVQAAGIPVIAANVGGISELVEDGWNGFLLSPNPTAQEVADCIMKFLNLNETEREQLRQHARQKWQHRFHAANNFESFARRLAALAASRSEIP